MISGIQSSGGSGVPAPMPAVAQAVAAPVAQAPKVTAPKPVEIQYDEAKSRKNLQEAVSALNDQMAASKTGLGFSIDKSLDRPVVIVRNTETGEVVRQIPTEVVVRLAHSIDAMKGLLLNATT
jgi:flagellar protein FlaG